MYVAWPTQHYFIKKKNYRPLFILIEFFGSAIYVVDLDRFRRLAAGDRLRGQYQVSQQFSQICRERSRGEAPYINLFPQSVKATMPIGIMGRNNLALLHWGSECFSEKEDENMNTRVWAISSITSGNCYVSFYAFGQPFSKRLRTAKKWLFAGRKVNTCH